MPFGSPDQACVLCAHADCWEWVPPGVMRGVVRTYYYYFSGIGQETVHHPESWKGVVLLWIAWLIFESHQEGDGHMKSTYSCKLEKPHSTQWKGEGEIIILSYVHQYGQIRRLAVQDPNVYQPRRVFLWALSVVFYSILLPCQPLPSKWLDYMKDTGIRIYRDINKHRVTRKQVSKIMFHKTPEDNKLLVCERRTDRKMHRHQVP